MKLGAQSHISIVSAVKKALTKYSSRNGISEITDIYMQPDPLSGNLLVCNDDEEQLIIVSVPEWVEANPENFMADAEMALRKVLNQLREEGFLNTLKIPKCLWRTHDQAGHTNRVYCHACCRCYK